jgi:Mg-chelatase subunit ChlD
VQIHVTQGTYARSFVVPIVVGSTVTVADGTCAPSTAQCVDELLDVEGVAPMRVMLMLDKSGSMSEEGLDGNRWESAKAALKHVTASLQHEAAFGLALFPGTDSNNICAPGTVNVGAETNNAAVIAQVLDQTFPTGGTPTGLTLVAVHSYLAAHPYDAVTLVILATDGVPNCNAEADSSTCTCTYPAGFSCAGDPEGCLDDNATVSAISAILLSGVRTYVIGLPGSQDPTNALERMAEAGGGRASDAQAYYSPVDTEELVNNMTSIVLSNRTCRLQLLQAPNDPGRVTVHLDGFTVPRDQGRRQGWDLVGQRGVELYGESCLTLQRGIEHQLLVHYCTDH